MDGKQDSGKDNSTAKEFIQQMMVTVLNSNSCAFMAIEIRLLAGLQLQLSCCCISHMHVGPETANGHVAVHEQCDFAVDVKFRLAWQFPPPLKRAQLASSSASLH